MTPMMNKFFNELYSNRNTSNEMSINEALEILGLEGKANNEQINMAYHKLMKSVHPDKGGSAYFAQKLNQARDKLLNSHH
ncbi:DnaJ domain-containing protein [Neoehrlichia mikurensis]|nr:DnaJ domain-containing protein [Neoehrlichia mikurensis]QXK92367.1 DnaJ domain-containing protein [Neoehrlichia mikurensis]QXK93211.1 DnaJ domain-containing protein [Neoehrlichia mikurensis]QXK93213.1 DnaJ domain-containing protein [Neoehrlichia mikurensis]QXK94058.1 DnaJ domain-containing protein [Neoehrlichia mikurensis]